MTPASFMCLRIIWDAHRVSFPLRIAGVNIKELHVMPETAHPFGRKGLAIESAWKQLSTDDMAGVLFIDGDVLIDPYDYMQMYVAIQKDPAAVHIAPVRLWPISKNDLEGWAWGHCRDGQFSQVMEMNPDFFAFNFTYVPRAVIEKAIGNGLRTRQYPSVDREVSRAARQLGTRMNVVDSCQPKHMHY